MKTDFPTASVGSSQAPTAAVEKSQSASNTKIQTLPTSRSRRTATGALHANPIEGTACHADVPRPASAAGASRWRDVGVRTCRRKLPRVVSALLCSAGRHSRSAPSSDDL